MAHSCLEAYIGPRHGRSARYLLRSCLCGQTRGTEARPSIAGILAWQRDAFLQRCIFHLASSPKLTLAYWQAWQSSEGASLRRHKAFLRALGVRQRRGSLAKCFATKKVCLARLGICHPSWILSRLFFPIYPTAILLCDPHVLLTPNPGLHNLVAWV